MNQAHLHLLVNHLPIIIPAIALLLYVGGMLFKQGALKSAALYLFILGAVATIAASNTGEGAEEVVEASNRDLKHQIHEHEEAAEVFEKFSFILALCAIALLWAEPRQKAWAKWLQYGFVVLAVVSLFMSYRTGATGGEIMHPELLTTSVTEHQE